MTLVSQRRPSFLHFHFTFKMVGVIVVRRARHRCAEIRALADQNARSYGVVANHEALSRLRPGFKSRYEHLW